jgi:hypothetical protein
MPRTDSAMQVVDLMPRGAAEALRDFDARLRARIAASDGAPPAARATAVVREDPLVPSAFRKWTPPLRSHGDALARLGGDFSEERDRDRRERNEVPHPALPEQPPGPPLASAFETRRELLELVDRSVCARRTQIRLHDAMPDQPATSGYRDPATNGTPRRNPRLEVTVGRYSTALSAAGLLVFFLGVVSTACALEAHSGPWSLAFLFTGLVCGAVAQNPWGKCHIVFDGTRATVRAAGRTTTLETSKVRIALLDRVHPVHLVAGTRRFAIALDDRMRAELPALLSAYRAHITALDAERHGTSTQRSMCEEA